MPLRTGSEGPFTLLLDYDGTLVPIAPRPELAVPDDELLELLAALSTRPRNGFAHRQWAAARGHRAMVRRSRGFAVGRARFLVPAAPARSLGGRRARSSRRVTGRPSVFERLTAAVPGSFIEEKTASLAWHYRGADAALAEHHLGVARQDARRGAGSVAPRTARREKGSRGSPSGNQQGPRGSTRRSKTAVHARGAGDRR